MPALLAFTAEQVRRLTGLTDRQLRYWDNSGFFSPAYADEQRRRPYGRVYSFTDLVGLRTLAMLRNTHKVPLQELREVAERLAHDGQPQQDQNPWTGRRFWVAGRHVFFEDPEVGVLVSARPKFQAIIPLDLEEIARSTEAEANRLRERDQDDIGGIERHRHIAHNAWVIAGTRIPTSAIWAFHEAGYDADGIVRQYPSLHPKDVEAAITYERKLREKSAA